MKANEMERRRFGSANREVGVIGQGTWYLQVGDRDTAIAAVRRGLDLGMDHIDTAEYYGEAENVVGEAIAGRRHEVFLVSKVVPSHASREGTIAACEHAVIPWCEQHDVAVVAYSPFGHGDFPDPRTAGGKLLQKIAAAHHATPRQVALRFLVRRPSVFAIPKASDPAHAAENAGAGAVELTDAEVAAIERGFPLGSLPSTLPML